MQQNKGTSPILRPAFRDKPHVRSAENPLTVCSTPTCLLALYLSQVGTEPPKLAKMDGVSFSNPTWQVFLFGLPLNPTNLGYPKATNPTGFQALLLTPYSSTDQFIHGPPHISPRLNPPINELGLIKMGPTFGINPRSPRTFGFLTILSLPTSYLPVTYQLPTSYLPASYQLPRS